MLIGLTRGAVLWCRVVIVGAPLFFFFFTQGLVEALALSLLIGVSAASVLPLAHAYTNSLAPDRRQKSRAALLARAPSALGEISNCVPEFIYVYMYIIYMYIDT